MIWLFQYLYVRKSARLIPETQITGRVKIQPTKTDPYCFEYLSVSQLLLITSTQFLLWFSTSKESTFPKGKIGRGPFSLSFVNCYRKIDLKLFCGCSTEGTRKSSTERYTFEVTNRAKTVTEAVTMYSISINRVLIRISRLHNLT